MPNDQLKPKQQPAPTSGQNSPVTPPSPSTPPIASQLTSLSTPPTPPVASPEPSVLKQTTIDLYLSLADRVNRRTRLQLQDSPEDTVLISPVVMVGNWRANWFKSVYATICLERSAMLWMFKTKQPFGWREALDALKLMQPKRTDFNQDNDVDAATVNTARTRPPGRMIPEEHFNLLIQTLSKFRNTFRNTGQQTQWFLLAGIASGARPIEWHTAKWIDEPKGILRIFNAKVKSQNAWDKIPAMTFAADDGDDLDAEFEYSDSETSDYHKKPLSESSWYTADFSRRISAISLTDEEKDELEANRILNRVELFRDVQIEDKYKLYVSLHIQSIQNEIETRKNLQKDWSESAQLNDEQIYTKHYYSRIRHCLWRASNIAFAGAEIYSLVDTRSTFSANRKGRRGLQEAASELGHSVTTSKDHYAPASKAWSQYKPVHGNTKKMDDQQSDTAADGAGGQKASKASKASASPGASGSTGA